MATKNQKDFQKLFVGGTASQSTGNKSTLNKGEIGIFTPGGKRITTGSAAEGDKFVISQKHNNGYLSNSKVLSKDSVDHVSVKDGVEAVEQLDFVGYNGTSGAIDVNAEAYKIKLDFHQNLYSNFNGVYVRSFFYDASATDTQQTIADGLAISAEAELMDQYHDNPVFVTRVCSGAYTAAPTALGNAVFTYGSKYVSVTDADDATTNAALAVGEYIGPDDTDKSTGLYKIAAIDTTNNIITLDTKFRHATATVAPASLARVTSTAAGSADWGIRIEERPQDKFLPEGKLSYVRNSWVTLTRDGAFSNDGFKETPITKSKASSYGSGTYEQVAELEWFLWGQESDHLRSDERHRNDWRAEAVEDKLYGLINFKFNGVENGYLHTMTSHEHYTVAVPLASVPAWYSDVADILETLLGLTANTISGEIS